MGGSPSAATTLVLIPGWRLPASLWTDQLTQFSKSMRVIAIDPRSQGDSTKTADGNTPESRARDLHDLLAGFKMSRPVLVGWSQGAQDVAAYIQQFGGDSIAGAVFVDSPVSFGPAEVDVHPEFAKAIISSINVYSTHPEEFSDGMVHSIFKKPHPELDIQAIVKSSLKTPVNTGIAMLVSDIFGADRRPALTSLHAPVLVIAAGTSPLLDVQKQMAGLIPGSKLVVIEGAGHAVFIDEPQAFHKALETFIRSLSPI
jgi:non-heme chloroperoxidase